MTKDDGGVGRVDKVLEARRRGMAFSAIARGLEVSIDEAMDLYAQGMERDEPSTDRVEAERLDLSRLDRMTQGLWAEASTGNPKAVAAMLTVMTARRRLLSTPSTEVTDAYDKTVQALKLTDADTSLIASGRKLAERIDAATSALDPVVETKTLYLVPHLMNVLRELGATPAARAAVKNAKEVSGGKLASLRALRAEDSAAS